MDEMDEYRAQVEKRYVDRRLKNDRRLSKFKHGKQFDRDVIICMSIILIMGLLMGICQ